MRRLHRDLSILLIAVFLIAAAEELWWRFVPPYIRLLGAPIAGVAAYGAFSDFLDAVYQLPGGILTARVGYRRALSLFNLLAIAGYAIFAIATKWWILLLALPLVMGWRSFSLPATFSMIGDTLPQGKRSVGFAYQSIVRRIPIAIAPAIGGTLLAAIGMQRGMPVLIVAGIVLALGALVLQWTRYRLAPPVSPGFVSLVKEAAGLNDRLKQLLISDILVRFGQGIAEVFIAIYVIGVLRQSPATFGWLVAAAMLTSLVVYIPAARLADAKGRRVWIVLTYAFFALFPLSLGFVHGGWISLAFVLMGLREIGEPPRKALIVDLSRHDRRSVDVGAYYLVRGLAVFPASFVGGALWHIAPQATFLAASVFAAAGTAYFTFRAS